MHDYISELCATLGADKPVSLEVIGPSLLEMTHQGRKLWQMFNYIAGNVWVKVPISVNGAYVINELSKEGIPVNTTLIMKPEQAVIAGYLGSFVVSPFAGRIDDYLANEAGWNKLKDSYFPAKGIDYPDSGITRVNDNGVVSGVHLVSLIKKAFRKFKIETKVLAASIRNTQQLQECLDENADITTMNRKLYDELSATGFARPHASRFSKVDNRKVMLKLERIPRDVFSAENLESLLYHSKTEEGIKKFEDDAHKVPEYVRLLR